MTVEAEVAPPALAKALAADETKKKGSSKKELKKLVKT